MEAKTNGRIPKAPPDPVQIREQRKLLRARIRLAQEKQLLESLWPWDDFGGNDLVDRFRPGQNYDDVDRWVPVSVPTDRRHGSNWPLWRTQQELDWLRQESRVRAATNSYAIGLLKNLTNNVIGKGCSYKVQALGDDGKPLAGDDLTDADEALAEKVQKCVDGFLRLNHWNGTIDPADTTALAATREREIFRTVYIDGECFLRFHFQEDGTTLVRMIDASRIRDGGKYLPQDGWTYGIQHEMQPFEDVETPLRYASFWPDASGKGGGAEDDHGTWDEIDAKYILHLKGPDTPSVVKRGLPYFIYDCGKAFDRASRLQRNLSTGAGVRAAVAWTEQWDQATAAQVTSLASALATRTVTDENGNQVFEERIRPGTIRRVPTGWKRGEESADNTPSYLEGVQGDLKEGGAAACAPAYWFGDTGDVNYNNAESAAAPAVRSGQCEQEYYKIAFARAVWKAVEWAVKCDELPQEVMDRVTIQVEFPAVLHRNELEKAQEDQIGVQAGWKDRQTCAAERGLDWETVKANNAEYMDEQGGLGMQLPLPGDEEQGGGQQSPKKPPMPKPPGVRESAEWDENKHPRRDDGEFGRGGGGRASKKDKLGADKAGPHPGSVHGSAVSIKATKERAFTGEPAALKTTLSKQETGRVGEAVSVAYLKTILGRKDARPMNTSKTNFPVDMLEDHRPTEVKAGLASNSRKAQQWRLTFSKESAAEKALYEKMTPGERKAWNAEKQARIHQRKEAVIAALERERGVKVKPRTMTVIVNPDTRTADVYIFDGLHDRIDWQSDMAKKGYHGSVKYA